MPRDYLLDYKISSELTFAKGILLLDQCENPSPWKLEGTGDIEEGTWDVSTAVYLQEFSVAAKETTPFDLFFKPDGLKMYTIGSAGKTVDEYDLDPAWDVTTAVYLQEFSVAAKETNPQGLFFRADGLKMYTIGREDDSVDEYDLGAAWDVTSAVHLQELSVAAKETEPSGLFFKPDGLKMYTIGGAGDSVDEYDLGAAWDISSAVYLQEFFVGAKEITPNGVFFKPDGLKMYTIGRNGKSVDEYDLGVAWDVTSAVYLQELSVAAKEAEPNGIFFKPDGSKLYTIGWDGDTVDEYDMEVGVAGDYDLTAEAEAAYFGLAGFKLVTRETTPALNDLVTATRKVAFPETDLLVYRMLFSIVDVSQTLAVWIRADFNDGDKAYAAALKYLPNGPELRYLDVLGRYILIPGYGQTGVDNSWISIELVLELKNHEYISCTMNGIKTSLAGHRFEYEGEVDDLYHDFQVGQLANGANQSEVRFDSVYIGEFLNI